MLQSPPRRPASAGLGKGASAGARKSGAAAAGVVPQLQESQQTRSARKTSGARVYRDEELADIDREREFIELADKSEDETASPVHSNVDSSRNMAVKSSSSASGSLQSQHLQQQQRTIPPASITSTDESSVLLPLVQSRRGGKDNMPYIPPGANRPGLGKGKGKGKAYEVVQKNNSLKRDAQTASSDSLEEERTRREETETEEDHSSSLNVRSRSPRGYTWEVEVLEIKPEDVRHRISYHNSITTTIEREGKNERVRFRRGDKIWILPDPQWLPPVSHEVEINELADDEWWIGEILDCCALDQESQKTSSLGLLRVAWYYSPDHAFKLDDLHSDWKKKIRKYRFDDPERIKSDHVDFVGIECFAGFADGIYTFLNISGLEVDDIERMKPERHRKKSNRVVRMTGFTLKETAKRQAAREAAFERNPGMARRVKRGVDERSTRRRIDYSQQENEDDKVEEQDYYA